MNDGDSILITIGLKLKKLFPELNNTELMSTFKRESEILLRYSNSQTLLGIAV